ncbi:hypothetical protein AGOR_G00006670 [Albula goreensis]|uniref:Uncharacterized protein n=1 Tax=Albula goreensis TaxID=1534307 RepID=A0A8T3EBD3_9TELE|nr:hypothetical protein AGOR_G00006670 [Albula goreensis]
MSSARFRPVTYGFAAGREGNAESGLYWPLSAEPDTAGAILPLPKQQRALSFYRNRVDRPAKAHKVNVKGFCVKERDSPHVTTARESSPLLCPHIIYSLLYFRGLADRLQARWPIDWLPVVHL